MPPAPLLDLLPPGERERLQALLRRVPLEIGETVAWPNDPIEHAHFPIDCVVSVIARGPDGEAAETGLIGREGVAGLPLFLRHRTTPLQLQCQVPGEAWRMRADDFVRESHRPGPLQDALLAWIHALLAFTVQGRLCNGHHAVDERCARWLLAVHDRVGRDRFSLTSEFLAVMLGAGRPGVAVALASLQRAGAIAYHDSQVTVTDRAALEAAACPCYRITADQFGRLGAVAAEAGGAQAAAWRQAPARLAASG
jgi:CRP-like cAMP-binding protein